MYLNELKAALNAVVLLAQAQVAQLESNNHDVVDLGMKKHVLSVVEQHLADLDTETGGLTTLINTARYALGVQLPFSAEESLALQNKQQAVEGEIRLANGCVGIINDMLTKYGALVTDDEEINGGDVVTDLGQWVLDAQSVFKQSTAKPSVEVFQGFIKLGSEFHQVSFEAPAHASVAEKDAAMMAALAQVAEIDYVSIGEAATEVLPGATAADVLHVMMSDLIGNYDVPDGIPEWVWVEQNACYNHVRNGQDGIWEFVVNLACTCSEVPDRLKATIDDARRNNLSYLIFHQGT